MSKVADVVYVPCKDAINLDFTKDNSIESCHDLTIPEAQALVHRLEAELEQANAFPGGFKHGDRVMVPKAGCIGIVDRGALLSDGRRIDTRMFVPVTITEGNENHGNRSADGWLPESLVKY